jgi:hypothetical protein
VRATANRLAWLSATTLLSACAQPAQPTPLPAGGRLAVPAELQDLQPTGDPQRATGQQLFELINGGAEIFLALGFAEAVSQEYVSPDGTRFTVEVYRMQSETGAKRIYEKRGGTQTDEPRIGDASTFEEYYGHYLAGFHYFTVTASRTRGVLRPQIERLARAVVSRLPPGKPGG